jgi:hypothetical protein
MNETALWAAYGLGDALAVEGRFSMRVVDVTPTYSELDGTPKDVPNDIHHHRETLVGPSDPWLLLRTGASHGRFVTSARLGLTLPVGSTVPDPYELGRQGLPHEHIQFGTGTVVPIVGGGFAYSVGKVDLAANALAFFGLYANGYGYRPPLRLFASSRATLHVAGVWLPFVGVSFVHEGRDLWHDQYGDEAYERDDILAGAGLGWAFARAWVAEAGLTFRVANLGSGPTLDYPAILQLGLATHFDDLPRR